MGKLTGRTAISTNIDENLLIHVVDTTGTPASYKATLSQLYGVFPKNSSAGAGDVNKVPKWTAANELGASIIEDDGSTATIGGTIKITGGSPSAGRFLQCDAAGLATWADVTAGVQVSGTPNNNEIAVWINSDTIEGDSNFIWDAGLDMTTTAQFGIDLTHSPSGASGTIAGHNIDLTGNASTATAYGFYSKVDTALGGNANGGFFRVLDSDGNATGSLNSVDGGSVGGTSYGSRNTVLFSGTETSGGSMYGSSNVVTVDTTGTHGPNIFGSSVDLNYNKVGGSLTNAFGFYSTGIVCNDSGATITNAYGVYLGDNAGAGTITNSYGVYQVGTDDKNYFGGQLQLNHTSGTAGQFLKAVDVDGNAEWADISAVTATSGSANQIAVFDGTDSIDGDANFVWDAKLDITATAQDGIDLTHNPSGTGTAIGHNIDLTGNANTTTAYGFYSKVDTSLGGSAYGGWFRVLGSDSAAFGNYGSVEGSVGGASYGAYNLVSIGGTNTSGGSMYGSQNIITISTSGTHGASMFGSSVDLNYNKVGGSLTNAFGFYSTGIVCNDSGATITNAYGIYLADNAGAGTITNSYGVYQDGADDQNYFAGSIESDSQIYSSIAATVTPSALAATIDWNNGNMQVLDLQTGGSINTLTINNPKAGASYFIKIIQGGGNTITWPAAVKWAENDTYAGSAGAGDIDAVALTYDGTNYLANYSLDYQ
jgi:hypothetical protein